MGNMNYNDDHSLIQFYHKNIIIAHEDALHAMLIKILFTVF